MTKKKGYLSLLFDINLPKKNNFNVCIYIIYGQKFIIIIFWENVGQTRGQFMCSFKSNWCLHK
jgi:hypothetical protein